MQLTGLAPFLWRIRRVVGASLRIREVNVHVNLEAHTIAEMGKHESNKSSSVLDWLARSPQAGRRTRLDINIASGALKRCQCPRMHHTHVCSSVHSAGDQRLAVGRMFILCDDYCTNKVKNTSDKAFLIFGQPGSVK